MRVWLPARDRKSITLDPINGRCPNDGSATSVDDVVHRARILLSHSTGRASGNEFTLSSQPDTDVASLLAPFLTGVPDNRVLFLLLLQLLLHISPPEQDDIFGCVFCRIARLRVMLGKVDWKVLELRQVKAVEPYHRARNTVIAMILLSVRPLLQCRLT